MRKIKNLWLLLVLLIGSVQNGFSQTDTTVYYGVNNKLADENSAVRYVEIKKDGEYAYTIINYFKQDEKWIRSTVNEKATVVNDSTLEITTINSDESRTDVVRKYAKKGDLFYFQDFFENGQVKMEGLTGCVLPLHLEGQVKEYYKSGQIESIATYENNQLGENENWLPTGEKYIDNIAKSVDVKPVYPGGMEAFYKYIFTSVVYPDSARKNNIQGRVFIKFVIDEYGNVQGVYPIRKVDPSLDEAGKEVIESISVKWTPAQLDGKNVRFAFIIPISFKLGNGKSKK